MMPVVHVAPACLALPALPSAWKSQFDVVPENPAIGSGAFGTIFQVRDRSSQHTFAVKVMQRAYYEQRGMGKQLSSEIQTMQRAAAVGDPGWSRVVQFHGAQEEGGYIFLLLELCSYGNVAQHLANCPGGISEATVARCARHLFQGLRDIHFAGIIHRDIKLGNLLLTTHGVLKICDFGWAAEASAAPRGLAGTFDTMAPEVLAQKAQTVAVDLWSAGAVLFHLVTGSKLLHCSTGNGATQLTVTNPKAAERKRSQTLLSEINSCCPPSRKARPAHVSEACWDLIRRLLELEPEHRPTAVEALEHRWLTGDKAQETSRNRRGSCASLAHARWGGA